ncbi:MAG: hypothetical protein FWH41_00665 [Treponema sp.]|nr:hypothetical protein [Treponema sp.]
MTATVLRKELHTMIEAIPEQSLPVIMPLMNFLSNDYWKPIIEPATPEEAAMIDERMKDYDNDPSSFSPLDF